MKRKGICAVVTKQGHHQIIMPDGTLIPAQISSIVTDDISIDLATATIELEVNIFATQEDAIKYNESNEHTTTG